MKNKKLFAILTLVCFMFTLMPVAAFAAVPAADGTFPVAGSMSAVSTTDTDLNTREYADFSLNVRDAQGMSFTGQATTTLYVWATRDGSSVPINTFSVAQGKTEAPDGTVTYATVQGAGEYVYEVTGVKTGNEQFAVAFNGAGTFKVNVSAVEPVVEDGVIAAVDAFNSGVKINVSSANAKTENMRLNVALPNVFDVADVTGAPVVADVTSYDLADGDVATALKIEANNVDEKEVVLEFSATDMGVLAGKTLKIETAGAIEASKETVTTDALGQARFTVSGNAEGVYKVYVSYGQFEVVIEVEVGSTGANSIECIDEPENPIDILNDSLTEGIAAIEFEMYDVNGNVVDPEDELRGWVKARTSGTAADTYVADNKGYVSIVEQPAASKLENKDLSFNGVTVVSAKAITVEGTYTFKVVLDNGNYATATIVVKEFTTPVELVLEYPEAIELGSTVGYTDLYWLDANKVEKSAAGKVTLAATGYAIEDFDSLDGTLTVKSDEKYVGNEITITAVDERYNLIDTVVVTVADDAKELAFATKTAEVKVNNQIKVNVVDSQGKNVTLGGDAAAQKARTEISYVILDKPADAKVFVSTVSGSNKLTDDGSFKMNLTSNVVGNVAVQAIVKYSYTSEETNAAVVKYYTGTQIFAVGTAGVGDVVVMSIGSNEIIINDAKAVIDAAPIVENNRTFVPFRALAEAFGATVAYDEATQAVTAELNGVTVVMTIGSAEYTVNGTAKTADVAPFINGSRTMVPVRFAAEAFGIKVIPTYDENGATADILFNL